jgi:hypothetical protein
MLVYEGISVVKESGTELGRSLVVLRVDPHSLSLQIVELHAIAAIAIALINFEHLAVLIAIIAPSIDRIRQIKFRHIARSILKSKRKPRNLFSLTQLQPRKAHLLNSTLRNRVKEINLIYVDLVIHPVHKITVYCLLQVSQRFQV